MNDNTQQIYKPHQLTPLEESYLIYSGLRMCQYQYQLGDDYAANLFSYFKKDAGDGLVSMILNEWECFEPKGRLNLNRLADPSLVKPCSRLMNLYLENGRGEPHPMFKEADDSPSEFNKMVFIYRVLYDILYALKLPFLDSEQANHFVSNTALFQLDDLLVQVS